MEGVLYTLTFRPIGGCLCMLKMRFIMSVSLLWMSSMTSTVTARDLGLLSIPTGNSPLDFQIAQQFIWGPLNLDTRPIKDTPSPYPSPQGSPSGSPIPTLANPTPANHTSTRNRHHGNNPRGHYTPRPSNPQKAMSGTSNRLNTGQMTGLVLLSIAGLLQVVVVTYLLVKRKQMLQVVEKYEV